MQKHRPKSTPWGMSQSEHVQADGIVWYETASHGGFHLSPERQAEFGERFPNFRTFAGGPWYEEDQDWAAVVLAFPELYLPEEIRGAVRTAHGSARPNNFAKPGDPPAIQRYPKWERMVEWLEESTEGQRLSRIANEADLLV